MSLRISHTGVRTSEFIVSAPGAKQCQGTIMQIRGLYPPLLSWTVNLEPEQIRDQFNNYSFFKNLTVEQRREWLASNGSNDGDLYMEDVDGLYVKFVKLSGTFILKALSSDQINMLLAGNPNDNEGYWLLRDVYNLFPRKQNSRARKHTLIFRPNNWTLMEDVAVRKSTYQGIAIHLESGTALNGTFNKGDYSDMFIVTGQKDLHKYSPEIAIICNTKGKNTLTYEHLEEICGGLGLNVDIMKEIFGLIQWFSPSPHKSLIQKIFRTRCTHVEYVGKEYPAKEVLATSFCMLIVHPGAFVPNIQRFVSGIESALKRLAVAICEDAWLENGNIITSLLAGAWIAQNVDKGSWIPSDDLLKVWISYGLSALDSPYMYEYNWHNASETITEWSSWYMSYYLLATVQSFDSDVKMIASIAEHKGAHTTFADIREKRIMPIYHCIDQHSYTDIAHYIPYNTVKQIGSYTELFKRIWQQVVGINPRNPQNISHTDEFFQQVRHAQIMIWISRIHQPQLLTTKDYLHTIDIPYELNMGWFASFVGSVEIKVGHVTAITMINPDDLLAYVAVKRPSRDTHSSPELTEEEKSRAISIFKGNLRLGLPFVNVPTTLPSFRTGKLRLINHDTEYIVELNGVAMSLEDASRINMSFSIHSEKSNNYMYDALTTTGNGIRENADLLFNEYLNTLHISIIQRALIYIGYNSTIDIHHIGRDGKGTEYSVTVEDTGVNYLLGTISTLYPAALIKDKSKYMVKNGPLMWHLVTILLSKIRISSDRTLHDIWPAPIDETRALWDHQIDAINNLISSRYEKKGRIIWIPPGLGKTAIIVNYIARQIQTKNMCKYCLYTLPPSAMETVMKEFPIRNIPYLHLDMRATNKGPKELVPGVVNIVYHDHLRMMDIDHVKACAPEMLFIVDEFHKTLNATIRTSTALEIAHLSADVIAMTGTLIKDTHIEPIIAWLSMAVKFEVTTNNYWVALSSIISRKVQTKVVVERLIREASLNDEEKIRYYNVVPSNLGGTADKISFRDAINISYEAISREIINMTMFHINSGLGVFVVARNIAHQQYLELQLRNQGITDIFLIGRDRSISLTPTDPPPGTPVPQVVITTVNHAEGYNLTRFVIMITGVYFSNEATRSQLEARINRINQTAPQVRIVIIHAGLVSYIHTHYEKARRFSDALKGFAKEVNVDIKELRD